MAALQTERGHPSSTIAQYQHPLWDYSVEKLAAGRDLAGLSSPANPGQ